MKAVPFITFYNSVVTDMSIALSKPYKPTFESLQDVLRKTHAYHELVSQPFAPEMLLSVFEGWENGEKEYFAVHKEGCLFIRNHREAYSDTENTYQYIVFKDSKTWGRKFYWGSEGITLNDFISDCTRAGIELEFKQEIAKLFE